MFSDPQTVTVNAVAQVMAATSRGDGESKYVEADGGEYDLHVSHTITKAGRARRMVRLNHKKIVADPLTAVNTDVSASAYLVIDEPAFGFTDTELGNDVAGLLAYLTTGLVADVLGGES